MSTPRPGCGQEAVQSVFLLEKLTNDVTEKYLVTDGRALFHSHLNCGLILWWHAASCREVLRLQKNACTHYLKWTPGPLRASVPQA